MSQTVPKIALRARPFGRRARGCFAGLLGFAGADAPLASSSTES
jgi:hypothetical protein